MEQLFTLDLIDWGSFTNNAQEIFRSARDDKDSRHPERQRKVSGAHLHYGDPRFRGDDTLDRAFNKVAARSWLEARPSEKLREEYPKGMIV